MSTDSWAEQEFAGAELGDKRLTRRLQSLSEMLLSSPELPINGALEGDWSATKAAYRFFSNSKVTPSKILSPHRALTHKRMKDEKTVLAIQDTTYLKIVQHPFCKFASA